MDFSNRNIASPNSAPAPAADQRPVTPVTSNHKSNNKRGHNRWMDLSSIILLFAVVILGIGVIAYIAFGNSTVNQEDNYVNPTKLQAVFLQSGQVYFGNIKTINNKYFVLGNIYYLQTANSTSGSTAASTTSTNNNVSLVKLGCELHAPYDLMVINASQVTFWENLQSNGQVATAVAAFQKANPHGQKCSSQAASSTSAASTVQNAGTTTTPTTTTTKP